MNNWNDSNDLNRATETSVVVAVKLSKRFSAKTYSMCL